MVNVSTQQQYPELVIGQVRVIKGRKMKAIELVGFHTVLAEEVTFASIKKMFNVERHIWENAEIR